MFALQMTFGMIMAVTAVLALVVSQPDLRTSGTVKEVPTSFTKVRSLTRVADQAPFPAVTLTRHSDGLFYLKAKGNGHSVRFVVDTGATVVVLNRADAHKLGVTLDQHSPVGSIRTVKGPTRIRWATIEELDVVGRHLEHVSAAVVDGPLPVSLMGHNALTQLGTVTLQGDTLAIH